MKVATIFNLLCQRADLATRSQLMDSLVFRDLTLHNGIVVRDFHDESETLVNKQNRAFDIAATKDIKPEDFRDVVSAREAQEIFDVLAGMKDIPHAYPVEGCTGRAHMLCTRLFDRGIIPKKAWAQGNMVVNLPKGVSVKWDDHVATALPVKMPDGSVQDMVFDPSLFDGPVTPKKWAEVMNISPESAEVCAFGVPPKGRHGDYAPKKMTSQTHDDQAMLLSVLAEYLPLQIEYKRFESGFKALCAPLELSRAGQQQIKPLHQS